MGHRDAFCNDGTFYCQRLASKFPNLFYEPNLSLIIALPLSTVYGFPPKEIIVSVLLPVALLDWEDLG